MRVAFAVLVLLLAMCCAEKLRFHKQRNFSYCSAVYGTDSLVLGSAQPNITLTLDENCLGKISYIIYRIVDAIELNIPIRDPPTELFCDFFALMTGKCKEEDLGKYLNPPGLEDKYQTGIINPESWTHYHNVTFNVTNTGYYCVTVHALMKIGSVSGYVEFNNPYGFLVARKYPHMVLTIVFAVIYLLLGLLWAYLVYLYRKDMMPAQKYVSVLFGALMLRYLFLFSYFEYFNNNGEASHILENIYLFFDAMTMSATLFLALVVAMGYGVLRPRLGESARKIFMLTAVHFMSGVVNSVTNLKNAHTNDDSYLLYSLPYIVSTGIFSAWIVMSLRDTMAQLTIKRQQAKLALYVRLTRIMTGCFLLSFVLMFYTAYIFISHRQDAIWLGYHWSSLWFWVDGWPVFLYFFGIASVGWALRPRPDNRRYGLEELPTSGDEDDLESPTGHKKKQHPTKSFGTAFPLYNMNPSKAATFPPAPPITTSPLASESMDPLTPAKEESLEKSPWDQNLL